MSPFTLCSLYILLLTQYPEYYAAKRVEFHGHSLSYQEIPTGIQARFRFTVTIFERRHEPFGDPKALFTKKIHAKQHASKQAIDWLIANKRMPADGSVRFPKPAPTPTPPKPKSPAIDAAGRPQSNASLVPELCHKLGFGMPKYEIERSSIVAPLYSGYAHFQGDVRLENRIGVVRDVYGQKAAREQIAEELVRFLRDIERQRMALIEKAAGKGKDAREETKMVDESSKKVEEAEEVEEDNKEVEEQIEKELAGSEEERKRKRGPLESPVKDQTEAKISKLIDIDSIQTE